MVATDRPLQEKMALFWHGHFATGADKVRDYRKMLGQLALFHQHGTGNFRELLIEVAQGPAMLVFLDAGQNVKGAPNENFAREVMELFTMGVGNYTETDIREAARAFTGWIDDDLASRSMRPNTMTRREDIPRHTRQFRRRGDPQHHPGAEGHGEYIAGKIYRYFVREDLSPDMQERLGAVLRDNDYEIAPLLRTIFLSRDFYSEPSVGTRIKGPVELIVSTYRELGREAPAGRAGFQCRAAASSGRCCSTRRPSPAGRRAAPGSRRACCLARGNFARDVLLPDMINFVDPNFNPGAADQARSTTASCRHG